MVAPQGAPDTAPSAQGTLIVLRMLQPEKAVLSIVVGVPLKVKVIRRVQLTNAYSPILVIPAGNDVNANLEQPLNTLDSIEVSPTGSDVNAKLEQRLNASEPILVIPAGNDVNANLEQSVNALGPIKVTPSGNDVNVNSLQP